MEKETVRYYVIRERIPEESRKEGLFYYELRHYDNNINMYVIESEGVIVNFYGTMVCDKDILGNLEYMERRDLRKKFNTIKDKSLL